MSRNTFQEAIVLSIRTFGEGHREAQILTENRGILRAIVFGGPRSKLKSLVSPYHSGRMWLYENPIKNSIKISDFDVTSFRPSLRENLYKTWASALCAELVLKTHGCEDPGTNAFYTLVCGFLDGLDIATESESKNGLLRFLWRYQILMGLNPDPEICLRCGILSPVFTKKNSSGENNISTTDIIYSKSTENDLLYYSSYEGGFICNSCAKQEETLFPASKELRFYLTAIAVLPPAQVRAIQLSEETMRNLKSLLFFLTEKVVDGKLNTLKSGAGIL